MKQIEVCLNKLCSIDIKGLHELYVNLLTLIWVIKQVITLLPEIYSKRKALEIALIIN